MYKRIFIFIIFSFTLSLLTTCESNITTPKKDLLKSNSLQKKANKIQICHLDENGDFVLIEVSENALEKHLEHGDEILDADNDGYTSYTACFGSKDDCDDSNPSINPGVQEICGDGIDNNCNGIIDEDCSLGIITGPGDVLHPLTLTESYPRYFEGVIDFGTNNYFGLDDVPLLSEEAQSIYWDACNDDEDAFAFDILDRTENAELLKLGCQIEYKTIGGQQTDLLLEIDGIKVGLYITKTSAYLYDVTPLLEQKLSDILDGNDNVAPVDQWSKQILFIYALNESHLEQLNSHWGGLDSSLKGNTIVIVYLTEGNDLFIYE